MALVYDQLGNVIGDDGTPDIPTRPDVDAMKFELAKKNTQPQMSIGEMGSNFLGNLKDYEQRLGLTNLKKLVSQIPAVKAVQPVAEVPISLASSVPAAFSYGYVPPGSPRKAYDEAQARAAAIQYQSTNPYTNQMLEDVSEAVKGLPPYIGTMGAARLRPSDVQVLGKQAIETGREISSIPADFRMAQQGLKRMTDEGKPTYGVSIQQMADELGDYAQRQRERGKPTVSILGAQNLMPDTKLNAVRNVNEGQLLRPVNTPTVKFADTDIGDQVGIANFLANLETVDLANPAQVTQSYRNLFFNEQPALIEAYDTFKTAKIKEVYPNMSDTDAGAAYLIGVSEAQRAKDNLQWLNEFTQLPEARALAATEGTQLPTLAEFEDRVKATESFKSGPLLKQIAKYAGTKEDPLLQAARQGLTVYSPTALLGSAIPERGLERIRRTAGQNPAGEYAQELADSNAKLTTLQNEIAELARLRSTYAMGTTQYEATTNKQTEKRRALEREEENNQNIKLARAYESSSDLGVIQGSAGSFKNRIHKAYQQFLPGLESAPQDSPMFDIGRNDFDRTGLKALGQQYINAILKGEIPPNQVGNMSLAKFLKKSVEPRIAQEKAEKLADIARREQFDAKVLEAAAAIPNHLKFGNVGAVELTKDMPKPELMRNFALDTEVLDFCSGEGGSGQGKKHFLTNEERRYTPVVDYVTGATPIGSSGIDRGYANNVKNGDQYTSMRDLSTGYPIAAIEFVRTPKSTATAPNYNLHYANGYLNGVIRPEYQAGIKDYLNSRASEINSIGAYLTKNIDLYDRNSQTSVHAAMDKMRIPRSSIPKSVIQSELPRFFAPEDLQDLVPTQEPTVSYQGDLESLRLQKNELQNRIDNGHYDSVDEMDLAQMQIEEFDREIERVERQIAEQGQQRPRRLPDIFAPDITPQIGQVLRNLVDTERHILASNIVLDDPTRTGFARGAFQTLLTDVLDNNSIAERPFDVITELNTLLANEANERPAIQQLRALARMIEERLADFGIQYDVNPDLWEPEPEMRMPVAQQPAPDTNMAAFMENQLQNALSTLEADDPEVRQLLTETFNRIYWGAAEEHNPYTRPREFIEALRARWVDDPIENPDVTRAIFALRQNVEDRLAQQPPAAPAQIDYASIIDEALEVEQPGVMVRDSYEDAMGTLVNVHGDNPQELLGALRMHIEEVAPLDVEDMDTLRAYGLRTNAQAEQLADLFITTAVRIERAMGRQREVFPGQLIPAEVQPPANANRMINRGLEILSELEGDEMSGEIEPGRLQELIRDLRAGNVFDVFGEYGEELAMPGTTEIHPTVYNGIADGLEQYLQQDEAFMQPQGQLIPEEQVPDEVRFAMIDEEIEGMADDIMAALDETYDFNNIDPDYLRSLIRSLEEDNIEDVLGMATPDFEINGEIPPALVQSVLERLRNTLQGIEGNINMMNEGEDAQPYATPREAFVTFVNANDQFEGPDGWERLQRLLEFIQRPDLREALHLQNFTPEQIQALDGMLRIYAADLPNRPPGRKDGGVVRMAEGGGVSSLHPLVQAAVARGDIPSNQARYYHDMYTTKGSTQDESAIRGMSEKEYNYYSKLLKDKQLQKNFYGGEIPERRPPPPSSPANLDLSREQLRALSYKEFGAPRSPFKLGASDNANVYPGASDAKYYDELKQAAAKDPSYQPYQDELTKLLQQNPNLLQLEKAFAKGGVVRMAEGGIVDDFIKGFPMGSRFVPKQVATPLPPPPVAKPTIDNFEHALDFVLPREGGYNKVKGDRGGATNYGITHNVYSTFQGQPVTEDAIRNMPIEHAKEIYKKNYWDAIGADKLDTKSAVVAFDAAVNQGPSFAKSLIAKTDGDVKQMLDIREQRYNDLVKKNPSKKKFKAGWDNRMTDLRNYAMEDYHADGGKISIDDMKLALTRKK